jgi:hypothetical protein
MERRIRWLKKPAATASVLLPLFYGSSAFAHGLGQRYDLPVPLWLYLTGAAAAVALSFVVTGLFVRGNPGSASYPRLNLLQSRAGRFFNHPMLLQTCKLLSVILFVLVILAGLLGRQNPARNLAPPFIWVIWWVGLAYVSALVGNLWALINPWKILFTWAEDLYRRFYPDGGISLNLAYPRWLGVWPGFLLFFAFAWIELIYHGRVWPQKLAVLVIAYSAITWLGMILFGKHRWLRGGEAFSIAFGLLARFAPTETRVRDRALCDACSGACRDPGECINCYECLERAKEADREWNLRPFAVGLLRNDANSPSMTAFVLLMLATVTFDGFAATPVWVNLEIRLYVLLSFLGPARLTVIDTAGLISFVALFIGVYLVFCRLMALASGTALSPGQLAHAFVFTLIPIALAYHLIHYLSYFLIQGQLMIPILSDPFAWGWNLMGTAGYQIDTSIVSPRLMWFTAVAAIVLGHIIAVYLAHVLALRLLEERKRALRSQYPMLVFMLCYTVVSLWIMAQPIVEGGGV